MCNAPVGERGADSSRCGGKMRGVGVPGGTQGTFHEQARSPGSVSAWCVSLQLRETFLMGCERWVMFLWSCIWALCAERQGKQPSWDSIAGSDVWTAPRARGGDTVTTTYPWGVSGCRCTRTSFGSRIQAHMYPCGPKNWVCKEMV